jgi:DNA-binding CsgD family transcriptional regulator
MLPTVYSFHNVFGRLVIMCYVSGGKARRRRTITGTTNVEIDRPPALLKVLHSDIVLNDEAETAHHDDSEVVPPTRTEGQSGYPLDQDICIIGRNPDCNIRIRRERTDVSRSHATIKRDGTRFRLYDHSTRGTFVNGQRVEVPRLLDSGDILGFGDSPRMLRFVDHANPGVELSQRESEILGLMGLGQTNKQIAASLHISPDTVNTHAQRCFEKLGVHSRTEAVMVAQAKGLIDQRTSGHSEG